jgi:hypothetical protein
MRYLLAIVMAAALGATAVSAQRPEDAGTSGAFTRIFEDLQPFAPPTERVRAALRELGRKGGVMDAGDNLAAGPIELIVNPKLSENNRDNLLNAEDPAFIPHTAGATFVGQFLDHDMTFDTTSRLGMPTNPHTAPNARRPFFDLDSVYGDGPSGSPRLYESAPGDRAKFRVEHGGLFEDLPREADGAAIIADPRNDENLVISGLQVAFLLFHNHVVDRVREAEPAWNSEDVFHEARTLVTRHYQWLLLHEFLPQFVGASMVKDVVDNGGRFYPSEKTQSTIPIEFQMAYRFGHSLVRPSYRANFTGAGGGPFFALLFDGNAGSEPTDLRGGARGSKRFIGWQTFFRFPGFETDTRPNKRIDTILSTPLFDLPLGAIASGTPPVSLAERNLLRHLTWNMPSGQTIAAVMGEPVLADAHFSELKAIYPPFVSSTPLWYYILREADVLGNGAQLGPVGGRLVAEVFIGLLRSDPNSILSQSAPFVPSLGPAPGEFQMIDLLRIAGVDPKR